MIKNRIKLIESDLRRIDAKIEIIRRNSELERLAEIGRATEKAFEKQTVLLIHYRLWDGNYEGEYEFEEIEELLEWHRKQEAE